MISTGDFKRGLRILVDGDPYVILDVHVQSPSARGASSPSKLKVRNLRTGQVLDKTFRGGDRVEEPDMELRAVQFLYRDDDGFHFMDTQSYEQFALGGDDLGDSAGYLTEGLEGIRSVVFNGKGISVDLPQMVTLRVVDTAPALKGATAQAQTKPATLETGLVIQVPSYLESAALPGVGRGGWCRPPRRAVHVAREGLTRANSRRSPRGIVAPVPTHDRLA